MVDLLAVGAAAGGGEAAFAEGAGAAAELVAPVCVRVEGCVAVVIYACPSAEDALSLPRSVLPSAFLLNASFMARIVSANCACWDAILIDLDCVLLARTSPTTCAFLRSYGAGREGGRICEE